MPLATTCGCTLCDIEIHLRSELSGANTTVISDLFSRSLILRRYSSFAALLLELKTSVADIRSDGLLRELFLLRALNPVIIESLLVLTFLPMLHGTVRRVAKQQPELSHEDIAQQALSILLQYSRSHDFRTRQSHFAFAISRSVKRQLFAWAIRESINARLLNHDNGEAVASLLTEETFEEHAFLRHFLNRCVARGLLTDGELDLLIQFKLGEAQSGSAPRSCAQPLANAIRQRMKRLLAKLRRLAN